MSAAEDALEMAERELLAAEQAHRKVVARTMRDLRARRKADGVCIQCGQNPASYRCQRCRASNAVKRLRRTA